MLRVEWRGLQDSGGWTRWASPAAKRSHCEFLIPAPLLARFDLPTLPFALQAPLLRPARRLGFAAFLGFPGGGFDQLAQAIQYGLPVALLRPLGLGGDVQFPGEREAAAGQRAQAAEGIFGEACDRRGGHPELHAGGGPVGLLAAGGAAAGELQAEGGVGGPDA